jgi:hypothetical protein
MSDRRLHVLGRVLARAIRYRDKLVVVEGVWLILDLSTMRGVWREVS